MKIVFTLGEALLRALQIPTHGHRVIVFEAVGTNTFFVSIRWVYRDAGIQGGHILVASADCFLLFIEWNFGRSG